MSQKSPSINFFATLRQAWMMLWKEKMVWIVAAGLFLAPWGLRTIFANQMMTLSSGLFVVMSLYNLVFGVVSMICSAFLIQVFYHLVENKHYQLKDLWKVAFKSFFRVLIASVLAFIAYILLMIVDSFGSFIFMIFPGAFFINIFLNFGFTCLMISAFLMMQIELVVHQNSIGSGISRGFNLIFHNVKPLFLFTSFIVIGGIVLIGLATLLTFWINRVPFGFDLNTLHTLTNTNGLTAMQIGMLVFYVFLLLFTFSASVAIYAAIQKKDRKMEVMRFVSPTLFLQQVQPFLESHEAANSLILGIALRLSDHPDWTEQPPYLGAVLSDSGSVLLAGLITPPHNLLLAGAENVPPEALALLAEHLRSGGWSFPAVHAANPLAEQFAQDWTQQTGKGTRLQMRQLIYQLDQVIPPSRPAAGELRQATLSDLGLSFEWRAAFIQESLHSQPLPGLRDELRHQIEAGLVYLWLDGEPVSTAVTTRPTPHGISISGVYTPPALRGRGYASVCVAALSQQILDGGKRFCTLFTDADYPASNAIYQAIGYRPIGEFSVFEFEQ